MKLHSKSAAGWQIGIVIASITVAALAAGSEMVKAGCGKRPTLDTPPSWIARVNSNYGGLVGFVVGPRHVLVAEETDSEICEEDEGSMARTTETPFESVELRGEDDKLHKIKVEESEACAAPAAAGGRFHVLTLTKSLPDGVKPVCLESLDPKDDLPSPLRFTYGNDQSDLFEWSGKLASYIFSCGESRAPPALQDDLGLVRSHPAMRIDGDVSKAFGYMQFNETASPDPQIYRFTDDDIKCIKGALVLRVCPIA